MGVPGSLVVLLSPNSLTCPLPAPRQEANRECQRLHRQLEEATAAHKAFAAEAGAREARMQAHLAEREATLQVRRGAAAGPPQGRWRCWHG